MRTGLDRHTGKILTGWAHCAQSIEVVLTTPLGSLLLARDFGSEGPLLIDRPSSGPEIARITMAAAEALRRDEPGFRLKRLRLVKADHEGHAEFEYAGDFYPNGHLGDFSVVERDVGGLIALPGLTAVVRV